MSKRSREERVGVRAYICAESQEAVNWYSFDLPNSTDEDEQGFYGNTEDSPIELQPSPALSINSEAIGYRSSFIGMGSKLYLLGGIEQLPWKFLTDVYCFDTAQENGDNNLGWQKLPHPMILRRSEPQVVAVDGKIFVMGGLSGPPGFFVDYADPELSGLFSHFEANWAEFYDPADAGSGWKPVEVRVFIDRNGGESFNCEPNERRPLLSFFGYGVKEFPAFIENTHFQIAKLGDHKILILCWESSFTYDVRTKTLIKEEKRETCELLRRKPFINQTPPTVVGDSLFAFDTDSCSFGAFDYHGKVLGLSGPLFTMPINNPLLEECMYPVTFRTDALHDDNDKAGVRHHPHFIRGIFSDEYSIHTNLLQLITLEAVPDKLASFKSVYFTVPTKLSIVTAAIFLPSLPNFRKVVILRLSTKAAKPRIEVTVDHSYFIAQIKKKTLCIPIKFVRANGISDGQVFLGMRTMQEHGE